MPCIPGKVWKFMRNYFEYVKDDPFDEIIKAPYLMPDLRTGDCDDFSLFSKSVLDILGGFYTYYILFGKEKDKFTHIAVYAERGNVDDPVIIDGVNKNFNEIPDQYNYYLIL